MLYKINRYPKQVVLYNFTCHADICVIMEICVTIMMVKNKDVGLEIHVCVVNILSTVVKVVVVMKLAITIKQRI